ncbi:putative uncharacterized protein [Roseburia sp. CAG:303]|nr:putative uncharacterized protein [Roseburia sp. CAG:303]
MTGQDLIRQLKEKELGDVLLLPGNVVREQEQDFLDDITLEELKTALQVNVNIVKSGGKDLLDAFTGSYKQQNTGEQGFVYKKCYPDR